MADDVVCHAGNQLSKRHNVSSPPTSSKASKLSGTSLSVRGMNEMNKMNGVLGHLCAHVG